VTTPVTSPAPGASDARAFVGRERELAELEAHLAAAAAGHGGLVLLGGEPGVGKTRLLEELSARARLRGMTALWGRCWEEGGAPPYWPWVQVLRAELRRQSPERLLAEVGVQSDLLSAIIPELATRPGPPAADATAGLDSVHSRFALFDAVAACFRSMASRGPVLLLLDDVHAADRPSLRLLAFLARELRGTPVLVVCAHRDAEVRATPAVAEALAEAARDGVALPLSGLPEHDVARFVETRAGVRASASVVAALHRQTGGNPFFLDEVVRLLVAEGRLTARGIAAADRLGVPVRIHDTIERRLAPLSPPCRELLELASVIGLECGLGQLATMAKASPAALLGHLDEARTAGIVTTGGGPGGRLRFLHALFREALYDGLGDARRVALHVEVGRMLEQQAEAPAAELAHHFLEAAEGGADVGLAVAHARRAAADATARLAYEDAARLYERSLQALNLHASPDTVLRGELLADLGEARQRTGDVEAARRTFEDALAIARRLDPARRGPLLARAALGVAGVGAEVGRTDMALVGLLDEALRCLDPADCPLRVRLLARLAAELAYAPDDTRRHALSEQAVAMAERVGDPATLGYALARRHVVLMEPGNAADRRRLASSIIELARRTGDRELAAEGRGWRLFAHLELSDLAGVERDLDALGKLAEEARHPHYLWLAAMFRAMRALLAARFEEAEHLANEALAVGQRHGDPNALVAYGSQIYALRWGQGRLDEIETLLRYVAAQHGSQPVWESARAHLQALLGRRDEARARFAPACDAFLALPRDVTWLPHLGLLGETCATVGDRARAETLRALLEPFAGQQLVAGPGAACFGPAARVVALLAATLGRWDEALAQLDRAEVLNGRLGALAWVAVTTANRAAILAARDGPGDREAARACIARARVLATRLGLRRLAESADTLAARLGDEGTAAAPPRPRQLLRHEGDHWTVEFAGRAVRVRDSKGMRLLAQLLRRPGEELHVAVLVAAAEGAAAPDVPALALEESERYRVSVTRAIHGVLDRVATTHPALGEHLARTIRTGMLCSYAPDPRVPTAWEA
jgi:tetratricopeptide (TPR) repeat protein